MLAAGFSVISNALVEYNSMRRENRTDSVIMQARFIVAMKNPKDVEANNSSVIATLSFRKSGYKLVE